jgi:hypothetical protein
MVPGKEEEYGLVQLNEVQWTVHQLQELADYGTESFNLRLSVGWD